MYCVNLKDSQSFAFFKARCYNIFQESINSGKEATFLQAQTNTDFSQGSVSSNIVRLAVPMTLAQLVNVLYNIIDRIYIGSYEEFGYFERNEYGKLVYTSISGLFQHKELKNKDIWSIEQDENLIYFQSFAGSGGRY